MNEFILFVMDDVASPSKYTQEQKEENRESAAARDADWYADWYAASATWNAAYAATWGVTGAPAADYWVNRYFEITGEDKTTYINKLRE